MSRFLGAKAAPRLKRCYNVFKTSRHIFRGALLEKPGISLTIRYCNPCGNLPTSTTGAHTVKDLSSFRSCSAGHLPSPPCRQAFSIMSGHQYGFCMTNNRSSKTHRCTTSSSTKGSAITSENSLQQPAEQIGLGRGTRNMTHERTQRVRRSENEATQEMDSHDGRNE